MSTMQDSEATTYPLLCSSTQPKKQERYCCRCRNHGFKNHFKGHRNECPYKDCPCDSCILVSERRRIVAKQVALKRRLEAEKKKKSYLLELTEKDVTRIVDENKKIKCSNEPQQLYSTPGETDVDKLSNSSPSPCFSSSSHSSSPAMEISSSEYATELSGCQDDVIEIDPVIYSTTNSNNETFVTYPTETYPGSTANTVPIGINKDKAVIMEVQELDSFQSCNGSHTSFTNTYSNSSNMCTPNAPSYGVSSGVVSSSTTGLSKMFPYDNGGNMEIMPNTGYNAVSLSVIPTNNKMTLLMRIFPEHKPLLLQTILERCRGDPIQCIETLLNLQELKEPPVTQLKQEETTFNQCLSTPVISPVYLPHQPTQTSIPVPNRIIPALSPQQQPVRMTTISATTLNKQAQSPSVVATDKCMMASLPGSSASAYNKPLHFTGVIAHQNINTGSTVAYPEAQTPSRYFGATSFQDGHGYQSSFTSLMCPSIAGASPQFTMHNIGTSNGFYPIQPMVPPTSISVPIHVKTEDPHYQTYPSTSVPHTQNTQMYCQTIGQIQPGKCLSYTASLQAAAIANPATPIFVPLAFDTGVTRAPLRDNQTPLYENQMPHEVSSRTSTALYKWCDGQQARVLCESDPLAAHSALSLQPCQGTDTVAAQALVSLQTSPSRKKKMGSDDSATISNFLMQH